MAKRIPDGVLDQMLAIIAAGTELTITAGEPADYNAVATQGLMDPDVIVITGPVAGSPDGRQLTIPSIADAPVTANGTADHVAVTNGVDTLLIVTTISNPQPVTIGENMNLTSWTYTLRDLT